MKDDEKCILSKHQSLLANIILLHSSVINQKHFFLYNINSQQYSAYPSCMPFIACRG